MDLWALGVLLHEAIEGERPFTEQELVTSSIHPGPCRWGAVQSARAPRW